VLSLFLSKNSEGIKSPHDGRLPIHRAAANSSLDVTKFLLQTCPESLTMVTLGQRNGAGSTLLHQAFRNNSDIADAKAIVEYLCKLCLTLVHMKCN
jgi:ankyrin repeat protein